MAARSFHHQIRHAHTLSRHGYSAAHGNGCPPAAMMTPNVISPARLVALSFLRAVRAENVDDVFVVVLGG